jgi:hypothetical protein
MAVIELGNVICQPFLVDTSYDSSQAFKVGQIAQLLNISPQQPACN